MPLCKKSASTLLLLVIVLKILPAQPGTLDSSFNSTGTLYTDMNNAMTVQVDGKLVTGGNGNDFVLERYKLNGTPDSTFGKNGVVTTDFGSLNEGIYSIFQLENGRISVIGYSGGNILLVQYLINGKIDSGYHQDGKLVLDSLPINCVYASLSRQADAKIIVAGTFYLNDSNGFSLTRYNINGHIDKTFGNEGSIYTGFSLSTQTRKIAIQKDGKIIVMGNIQTRDFAGVKIDSLALARYNPDGGLDSSFNHSGKLTMVLQAYNGFDGRDILLEQRGKFIIGGRNLYFHNHGEWVYGDFAVMKFQQNGTLDSTFNGSGITLISSLFNGYPVDMTIARQSDGKILVAGSSANWEEASASQIQMARLESDGTIDNSFGSTSSPYLAYKSDEYKSLYNMSVGYKRIYVSGARGENPYSKAIFAVRNDGIPFNPVSRYMCSTTGEIYSDIDGVSYQWQVSTDSITFNNLNNSNYNSGTTSSILSLNNVPNSWSGYQFRCLVGNSMSNTTSLVFLNENQNQWTGIINDEWENPSNWLCDKVPDSSTKVIVNSGNIVIHSNVTIADLHLQSGASLKIANGFTLSVASKE